MSTLDVRAEARAALDEAELIGDRLDKRIEGAVERVLARRAEQLESLAKILGISAKAASARLTRDPELRKIGVQVGSKTFFTRSSVESYYRAKAGMR